LRAIVAGRRPRRVRSATYSATVGRQALAADPGGKGAEIAPVGGVGALARGGAAGFGGRPGVGAQLVDRRLGVGREDREGHCVFVEQRFGHDRHVIRGFDTGLRSGSLGAMRPTSRSSESLGGQTAKIEAVGCKVEQHFACKTSA
jgi:hypothetical protein